jgi:hypothetical protein
MNASISTAREKILKAAAGTALAALAILGAPRTADVAHAAQGNLGSQLNDGQR